MKKEILDWQGVVVGELELPDETPESVWAEKLAFYAVKPEVVAAPSDAVSKVEARQKFGESLITEFVSGNLKAPAEVRREVATRTEEVQRLLLAGSLEPALIAIGEVVTDELLPLPALNYFKGKIEAYLAAE